jgi:hypothetical protein
LNAYGQIGNGNTKDQLFPTQLHSELLKNKKIKLISAEKSYSSILTNENNQNEIFSWGKNDCGNIGDNTTIDRFYPTKVINTEILDNLNVLKLFAMNSYQILFTNDGIFAFGESQEIFFKFYHYITKINFFKTKFKNIILCTDKILFTSYKNEFFGFFDNFMGRRESFIKDPITVKFKCNNKIFDKDSCGPNGNCVFNFLFFLFF